MAVAFSSWKDSYEPREGCVSVKGRGCPLWVNEPRHLFFLGYLSRAASLETAGGVGSQQ